MRKAFIFFLLVGYVFNTATAQHADLSPKEKHRVQVLKNFCKYVKQKQVQEIDQTLLLKKYLSMSHILDDTTQAQMAQKVFNKLLKDLDTVLDTTSINRFGAVPWNKYEFKENLPTMLWESEPLTHIWGKPLPDKSASHQQAVIEGRKQLENILVCFKKDKPEEPLYFILFDEKDKIVSWLLLNQGGLHYFLLF